MPSDKKKKGRNRKIGINEKKPFQSKATLILRDEIESEAPC